MRLSVSVFSLAGLLAVSVPAFSAPKYTPRELALLEATLERAPELNRRTFLARHLAGVPVAHRESVSTLAWGVMAAGMRSVVSRAAAPAVFSFALGQATLKDLVAPFLSDFDSIAENARQSEALARAFVDALKLELSARVTRFPFGEIAVDADGFVLRVDAYEGEATLPRWNHDRDTFLIHSISAVTRPQAWSLVAHAFVSANDGRFQVRMGETKILELLETFSHFLDVDSITKQKLLNVLARALTGRTNVFPFGTIQVDSNGVVRELKP